MPQPLRDRPSGQSTQARGHCLQRGPAASTLPSRRGTASHGNRARVGGKGVGKGEHNLALVKVLPSLGMECTCGRLSSAAASQDSAPFPPS
eukprot:CAMPEP_0114493074 /NCGR_PEP_ID=MMETSP0109-20121206/3911_1 /TAXON_ID=29199 /ORGANISM="Chlorarachnion reptans, Strain CCCM449" /LENGTH=90 /DNA_ID=CAMNT_0001669993 /DNA_START=1251 /DNA_END=1519 /DNA_ORIENTATION=+